MTRCVVKKQNCVECPYLPENADRMDKGQKELIDKSNAVFPCHMEMRKVIGTDNVGVELYASLVDDFVVCKGRAEEMKKDK